MLGSLRISGTASSLARDDQRSRNFVRGVDIRLGVEKFASKTPGVLADGAMFLDEQNANYQFEHVCDLIALASGNGDTSSC